jgi:C-terminal processing protease CtpA/Prc
MFAMGLLLPFLIALAVGSALWPQQKQSNYDPATSRQILHDAYDAVKKNYYDPKYHGLDWDAHFREYDEKIKSAGSLSQALTIVAAFLDALKDSHTFFRPPPRPFKLDYGYRMQVFGDNVFITRTRPETDAESKVRAGDQVLTVNNVAVNRDDFQSFYYFLNMLAPQGATQLVLRDPAGQERQVQVNSKVQARQRMADLTQDTDLNKLIREEQSNDQLVRQRYSETGDVMIWKVPEFVLEDSEMDRLFGIARKHKSLIFDLRGDPGGLTVTLQRMVGNIFDHDVKISDRMGKKETKPQLAKTVGKSAFSGQIMVLVDSRSASAAELFARVIQLEHRGVVIGDRTSGSVMEARGYSYSQGMDTKIFYGFSVTDADLIMADGKSLEHTGVIPDEIVLPTAQDLATGQDPALARAGALAGIKLDPAEAGKLFPFEWVPF